MPIDFGKMLEELRARKQTEKDKQTQMSKQAREMSNEPDDLVSGGLYPGGTGIVDSCEYKLWDYAGTKPPDSYCAVRMMFTPTDGSNEGKQAELYWSVGAATDYIPNGDGGKALSEREGLPAGSNWGYFTQKLRDNCGLERGKLSGPTGIHALEGSELTLSLIDPPKGREALSTPSNDARPDRGPKKVLVPTRAKFVWERGAAARTPATTTAAGPATTPSAPRPTPAANGAVSLPDAVAAVLAAEGGAVVFAELPAKVGQYITANYAGQVTTAARLKMLKEVKDAAAITALAAERGWTFDGEALATQ